MLFLIVKLAPTALQIHQRSADKHGTPAKVCGKISGDRATGYGQSGSAGNACASPATSQFGISREKLLQETKGSVDVQMLAFERHWGEDGYP